MSYILTNADGSSLVTITDGVNDTTTTSLTLIARNVANYGQSLNENFVKLLESFAGAAAPSIPSRGQLWWDTGNKQLNVYTGTVWKPTNTNISSASAPSTPNIGDIWWDTTNGLLKVYSSGNWIPIGPTTPPGTPQTALVPNTVTDSSSGSHIVGNVVVQNKLAAIFSSESTPFTPAATITGYPAINPGLNVAANVTAGNIAASSVSASTIAASSVSASTIAASSVASAGFFWANGTPYSSYSNAAVASYLPVFLPPYLAAYTGNITAANFIGGNIFGSSLTISGAVAFNGAVSFPSNPNTFSNIGGNIIPSTGNAYTLGNTTNYWTTVYANTFTGVSIRAQYADLAERFEADAEYEPGTVVEMGGEKEITAVSVDLSDEVFGVISTNAAYLMNSSAGDDATHPPIAVQGRVPVKVIGAVRKGDRLVSAGNGFARAGSKSEITAWNVIGRALENKTTLGEGVIEAVVKLNS